MDEQKRILITGASGFIGGFLVDEALRRGYEVWAGVRLNSSRENLRDKRIRFINLRYDDKDALTEQLREVASVSGAWHYVIHNAGITKAFDTSDFYKINALYTHNLIESLAGAHCIPEKFLLMSSLSSYGPVKEYSFRPINVDDEQRPDSIYGKSKLEAELFVKAQNYFPYVIFCPTGVYGPGDKDYLLEIKSVKSGFDFKVGMKPQSLTFIYVKDLTTAVFLSLENTLIRNSSHFITDGDVYTDEEFSIIIKRLLGKRFVFNLRIPLWICYIVCFFSEMTGNIFRKTVTLNTDKYKILKQRNWVCETDSILKEFDFMPKYKLKEGLEETIRSNKERGLI